MHGRAQPRRIAGVDLVLYPIFHPAAALYTPSMLDTLRADFAQAARAARRAPAGAAAAAAGARAAPAPEPVAEPEPEYAQLGLF